MPYIKLVAIISTIISIATISGCTKISENKIHVLEQPLRIASENHEQYYLLPSGTTLNYDASLPEGSDRFFVYINVEGEELKLIEPEHPDYIAPLTAYPFEGEDIVGFVKNYPVSKKELLTLLKSNTLNNQDAQDIIDYLQTYITANQKND